MKFDFELVGKVGSMALISKADNDVDYNIFARICRELVPGYVFVSSGATEIGRIDYIKRHGRELSEEEELRKTDYASQGQAILMENYRRFIDPKYSVRQVLVEHTHFNNDVCREHLKQLLYRCPSQNAIPIINYNDAVSDEENVKMEISELIKNRKHVVECVDNDETATQIACLVRAKRLLILTGVDGIYTAYNDPTTLIKEISGKDTQEVLDNIEEAKKLCNGASRKLAGGAKAKLEYIKEAVCIGTEVIIANSKYKISDILAKRVPATTIGVR